MRKNAGTITLSTGRELWLQELTQRLTYEGLLEGLPTTNSNKAYLKHLVEEQRAKPPQIPVYLVTPAETPISGPTYPRGSPATLPGVTCIGRFQAPEIDLLDYSELTVIWLQSEFAMPIEPSVLEEMARLDWNALGLPGRVGW